MCMDQVYRPGVDRGAGLGSSFLPPSLPHTHSTCWVSVCICWPREESRTRSVSVLLHLTTEYVPLLIQN